jgi:hypothetical protein
MKTLRSLILIFNLKSLLVVALACISTYLCGYFGLKASFPETIISVGVVFPIVFSISGAYSRREDALKQYSSFKAHSRALYFASRDWLSKHDEVFQEKIRIKIRDLMSEIRSFFRYKQKMDAEKESSVYERFSELSLIINQFRERELQSGEVSRLNQYLSKMLDSFENMKHVYQYRTPVTLRAYSKVFIIVVPIVYGPHFANIAANMPLFFQMILPTLIAVVMVSLDNIQNHLENPFDQVGEDDVKINAEKFTDWLH